MRIGSKILKVSNVVDPVDAARLWGNELREIQMDMKDELGSYGKMLDIRVVDPHKEILGGTWRRPLTIISRGRGVPGGVRRREVR